MSVAQLQNSFVNNITFETLSSPKYNGLSITPSPSNITILDSNVSPRQLWIYAFSANATDVFTVAFNGIYTPVNAGTEIYFTIEDALTGGNVLARTGTYGGTRWGAVGSNIYAVPIPFSITASGVKSEPGAVWYVYAYPTPPLAGGGTMATLTDMNSLVFIPK